MPIGFSSAPRNLFLFGSAGTDVVTNFFKTINQSAGTDEVFVPDEIRYNYTDQKYVLAGSASDSNSKSFGWFEKRNDAGGDPDWNVRVEAGAGVNTTLRAMELDGSNNLIVVGESGNFPWIAKYSNGGVIDWQATTFSGNVTYTGVASDSNGNYYACGNTPESGEAVAFVEKYATNGTPNWGKSAFMLGRDVVITSIDANSRGEVIAVGYLEDDSADKGYIIKIDTTTGDVMWDRTLTAFGGGFDIQCTDVFIDTNDQIYVTASSNAYGYLLKYTAEGNMIWQKRSNQSGGTISYDQVYSDGGTEQTVVFAKYNDGSDTVGVMSKYTKNGDLVWRRTLTSSFNNSDTFANLCLDADPSFYYFLYTDSPLNVSNGTPDKYTFGKVSSSGNGLGTFQYDEGTGQTIDYEIVSFDDIIGRLSDGSVRNDSSDLISYPFTANKILFDDLATHVSNKRRQMDGPGSFEYGASGSAIRPADFQETNLLGDVYSGSGDWLDQSGNGNDAQVSFTTTAVEPFSGSGSIEFDGVGDYLSLANSSNFNFGTGDFTIEMWVYHTDLTGQQTYFGDTYGATAGIYTYKTSNNELSFYDNNQRLVSSTNVIQLNTWHHVAWTKTSGVLRQFLDGVKVGEVSHNGNYTTTEYFIGDTAGTSSGEMYGYMSNVRVIKGTSLYTSNFTPPTSALTNTGQTTTSGANYSKIYSSMLTSPGLKTETAGFTAPHSNTGANPIRSEGTGGLLFTPTNPISYSSQVRVLDNNNVTACWFNQTNSSGSSTQHSNGWVTVASGSGTINTMYFERTDNSGWDSGFCAIEVDGTILEDTVWSPDNAIASNKPPSQLFDGNTGTRVETVNAGGTVRWTPDTTISWSSSLRINTGAYSGSITVRANGTTTVIHANGTQVQSPYWTSHPNSSGTIEYIEAQGHIGAGTGYMTAIEVDGTILVNGSGGTTGTMLLTAQGASITDASDSNLSITVNGDAAASVGGTNTVAYNASGGYFDFEGTDDYIQLGTNSDLTFAGDFSYETWLWTYVQPASNTIWSLPNGQTFQFTTLNSQQELIYYSAQTNNQSFGPLANNTWAHYIITKSGNTITGYLNGAQAWTSTPGSSETHNFSGASIGYRTIPPANSFYWYGRMGEIRIYSRALTAVQVFQNYNATKESFTGVAASTNPGLTSTKTP